MKFPVVWGGLAALAATLLLIHCQVATASEVGSEVVSDRQQSDKKNELLLERNDIKVAVPKGYTMGDSNECEETKTTMKITFERLSNIKDSYMDKIIENLEVYIPLESLEFFELFNQKTWRRGVPIHEQQPKAEKYLQELSKFYNIQYTNEMLGSWYKLVESIYNSKFPWCLISNDKPSVFWMRILKYDYPIDSKLK